MNAAVEKMGVPLTFTDDAGPALQPARDAAGIDALRVPDPEEDMPYVLEAIRLIRQGLAGKVPLIGILGPEDFRSFAGPYVRRILDALRPLGVPTPSSTPPAARATSSTWAQGILPPTPPAHAEALVDMVHRYG